MRHTTYPTPHITSFTGLRRPSRTQRRRCDHPWFQPIALWGRPKTWQLPDEAPRLFLLGPARKYTTLSSTSGRSPARLRSAIPRSRRWVQRTGVVWTGPRRACVPCRQGWFGERACQSWRNLGVCSRPPRRSYSPPRHAGAGGTHGAAGPPARVERCLRQGWCCPWTAPDSRRSGEAQSPGRPSASHSTQTCAATAPRRAGLRETNRTFWVRKSPYPC